MAATDKVQATIKTIALSVEICIVLFQFGSSLTGFAAFGFTEARANFLDEAVWV